MIDFSPEIIAKRGCFAEFSTIVYDILRTSDATT
jgi:hypothetical protein